MVRKSAMRVLAVVALLLGGASCSLTDDSADVSDLVVAATLELTGANADIGRAHQQALTLKVEQINASGVLGDRKLEVVVKDNQSKPDVAVAQITDFAGNQSVSAIISGACSKCALDGAKVANDKQVPLISLAAAGKIAAQPQGNGRNFVFKLGPNGNDSARALLGEIVRTGGAGNMRRLAVLYPDDEYGADGLQTTADTVANTGVTVVGSAKYKADGSNLKEQARTLVADKPANQQPTSVLVWALPAQAGPAAEAIRAAEFTGPIYYDTAAAGSLFLANAAAEGATTVFPQTLAMDDVIATSPAKANRRQWFNDYTARYGAYHGQSSFAADALDLVVNAVDRVGTNRAALQGVLESTETDGLSGPIRMTPANHSGLMPQGLEAFIARGGRWRLLG